MFDKLLGRSCTKNPKNVCIKKKKYRDDEILIGDYDIYMIDRKNPVDEDGEENTVELSVIDLLKNTDNVLKNVVLYKLDNSTDEKEKIYDIDKRVHRAFTNRSVYDLYITLDESDTYKFEIQLQKGFEMDYYRLFRIAAHSAEDLLKSIKSKEYGNRFNPIDRLKELKLTEFSIKVFQEGFETNNKPLLKKNFEIYINYIHFDPEYKLVF
jgi:hypothetical protein